MQCVSVRQERVERYMTVEYLQRALPDDQRFGERRGAFGNVDDAQRDTVPRQRVCCGQTHWAGTTDKDRLRLHAIGFQRKTLPLTDAILTGGPQAVHTLEGFSGQKIAKTSIKRT